VGETSRKNKTHKKGFIVAETARCVFSFRCCVCVRVCGSFQVCVEWSYC